MNNQHMKYALIRFKLGGKFFDCKRDHFVDEFIKFIEYVKGYSLIITNEEHDILLQINVNKRCIICLQYHDDVNCSMKNETIYAHTHGDCFYICYLCSKTLNFTVIIIHTLINVTTLNPVASNGPSLGSTEINRIVCDRILKCKNFEDLCNRYTHNSTIMFIMIMKELLHNDIIMYMLTLIY